MSNLSRSERTELVQQALGEARLGPKGWYRSNCPFCVAVSGREDKRWSLGIQAESGFYHCFRCGTAGRLRVDVEALTGHEQAIDAPDEDQGPIDPPEGFEPLWRDPALTASCASSARRYLRERGFGRATWQRAQLGLTFDGLARNRIVIPVLDTEGETWLGWIARDWTGVAVPKYLYPSGMPRGTILYEHRALFIETDDPVLVVEGGFDAMPYLGDAVACLGKPSKWQKEALKLAKRPVAICLDGDAWEEAYALSMQLRLDEVNACFVRLPPKEDPCSMAQKEGSDWLRAQAKKALTM